MKLRPAATMAPRGLQPPSGRGEAARAPRIVATVARITGPIQGVDRVRIDAASGSLRDMLRLRGRYRCPAMLDLPGPGTGSVCSPLTTTELLVFASAERFDWVGLRGVRSVDSIVRARRQLHPAVRIAATVHAPSVIEESLETIVESADALVLHAVDLAAVAGPAGMLDLVHAAADEGKRRGRPCFVTGGLLHSSRRDETPEQSEVDQLAAFLSVGVSGFVLDSETTQSMWPQNAIDFLSQLIRSHQSPPKTAPGAARLSSRPTYVH